MNISLNELATKGPAMDFYVNPHVKNMERIFPMQGRYDYQRYDMNENPEGLPHWFVQEVLTEINPHVSLHLSRAAALH